MRFTLAAAYVFLVPLFALIALQILAAKRLGEVGALLAGLAASAVLLAPAAWKLRRPSIGPIDVDH